MKKTPRFYAKVILTIIVLSILFAIFSSFQESPSSCGIERRLVKSLNDSDAKKINFTPKRADVIDLIELTPPSKIGNYTPRFGNEFSTYQINCTIREYRKEDDGDYHLVLQQTGDSLKTMVGEIINPTCDDLKNNPHLQEYIKARADFEKCILPKFKVQKGYYKIQGPVFFDKIHGQLGVSKNGVEIHPILSFIKIN